MKRDTLVRFQMARAGSRHLQAGLVVDTQRELARTRGKCCPSSPRDIFRLKRALDALGTALELVQLVLYGEIAHRHAKRNREQEDSDGRDSDNGDEDASSHGSRR